MNRKFTENENIGQSYEYWPYVCIYENLQAQY